MKVQFSQSFDFNQMLVFSVFWHLLILTIVLFLPKSTLPENTVVPAFMVSLVSEPTGFKSAAQERSESEARKKDVEKKAVPKKSEELKKTTVPKPAEVKKVPIVETTVSKPVEVKKVPIVETTVSKPVEVKKVPIVETPVSKPVEVKKVPIVETPVSKPAEVKKVPIVETPKPNEILEDLNRLERKMALTILPRKKMVEELDQLARLEKPKIKPPPAKPIKQKSITEKTFRELEALKNKKIKDKKVAVPIPLHKDILEGFEELNMEGFEELNMEGFEKLRMKERLPETPRNKAPLEKQQKPVSENNNPEKPKTPEMDLLKELEQLAKMDDSPMLVPDVETETPETAESTQKSGKLYDSILEKLNSLLVDSKSVKVEISSTQLSSSSFQSKLRTLPKVSQTTAGSGTGDSYVFAKKEGTPGADVQSLYVGMIQEKIYRNWREPLAEEHNQETVVSFYIFPRGNIDKPFIKKSSGVTALDTLAVRAVLDSVPFPEFPSKLKMSNLHVNIYFKYVPKDE